MVPEETIDLARVDHHKSGMTELNENSPKWLVQMQWCYGMAYDR
jgi:hypothetical protein